MSGIKNQFICSSCGNLLWINYHKIDDNKYLCESCFSSENNKIDNNLYHKFVNDVLLNHAFNSIRGFVEKYGTNYNEDELHKLEMLLMKKYSIEFNENILVDYIHDEYNKLMGIKELEELEQWESEFCESTISINKNKDIDSEQSNENVNLYCSICNREIEKKVFYYSKTKFGKALCYEHQGTKTQRDLYFELKKRGLFPEFESFDGHKHVDIAIHDAKLYIELDGDHHFSDPEQLEADILRDQFSMDEGYTTRRFSNREVDDNLHKIADCLTVVCRHRKHNIQ